MPTEDDSSDLSSLSSLSPVPSDVELDEPSDSEQAKSKAGILKFFPKLSEQAPKEPSPPPRKRSPSPPHEYVLADNPDIAFIVMFRSRFHDAFPKYLAHFGPQELERDVVEPIPGDRIEHFLCALLGLLLNRKQDVKPGHYGRALEDAINTHKNQWSPTWENKNPLSGGASFTSMKPTERLTLLRTLVLWSLASSDIVKGLINQAYKQNRHEDDMNQPRAVQPWGSDGDKRRYFLVEGQDDSAFRVYRESNPAATKRTWWSVAGSIDELKALAEKLETKDGGPKATKLSHKIWGAIPRFEAGEDKRKRREYRLNRKEQFKRPEPGFSLYEGRTRGKKMKYTYSDDEDTFNSDSTNRRSTRNTGTHTPVEAGPVTTSSGRQIRAPTRLNAATGSSAPGSVKEDTPDFEKESSLGPTGRPRRSAAVNHGTNGWAGTSTRSRRNTTDSDEEESEAEFGDDEEDADALVPEDSEEEDEFDEAEAMVEDDLDDQPRSLVVKLSVSSPKLRNILGHNAQAGNILASPISLQKDTKVDTPEAPLVEMQDAPALGSNIASKNDAGHTAEGMTEQNLSSPERNINCAERAPPTPATIHVTPLAFRGSPEKPHAQLVPRSVELGTRE
ncbi:Fc.00g112150.m01.CDS01 [Cosmosporella sp. VM-42]